MKKQFTVQILKGGGSLRLFHTDKAGTSLSIITLEDFRFNNY